MGSEMCIRDRTNPPPPREGWRVSSRAADEATRWPSSSFIEPPIYAVTKPTPRERQNWGRLCSCATASVAHWTHDNPHRSWPWPIYRLLASALVDKAWIEPKGTSLCGGDSCDITWVWFGFWASASGARGDGPWVEHEAPQPWRRDCQREEEDGAIGPRLGKSREAKGKGRGAYEG